MKTTNIIQAQANVIKITSLKKGDVIKLIESGYSSPESYFAVVLDLLNDGENTFIELLKYKKSFSSTNAEIVLYKGDDNISIFPTDINELKSHFGDTLKNIEEGIKDDEKSLKKKIDGLAKAKEFISGELSKQLSAPEYETLSQGEYQKNIEEKERKLKEISLE